MVDLENLYEGSLIQERYEIKELIGQGASSNVYKAKDLITNTYVAIKILKDIDDGLSLESFIERMKFFRREYKLLQKISHPNIICILDSGVYDYKYLFIVMEFLEGTTLSRIISENFLAPKRVVNILKQLAQGVEAMHSQGVIHRDLNPNNIWISGNEPDEKVKILDFGTAKLIEGVSEEEYLQTITTSGKVVGTLCYLSPEQCRCQKLDIRTDIYSLGIIVYEMLNGYPPFNSESPVMIAAGHMRLHPKEFTEAPNKLQPPVFKALEKDPQNRFSNATEFADAFEKAVVEENFSSSSNLEVDNIETTRNTHPQKQTFWQTLASWSKKQRI